MPSPDPHQIRRSPEEVAEILDRLDATRQQRDPRGDRRLEPRYDFRASEVRVEIAPEQELPSLFQVASRNVSRDGLSILISRFIHPQTHCSLLIPRDAELPIEHRGRIVRCRYVVGSGLIYEAGVQFTTPLDLRTINCRSAPVRLLLIDSEGTLGSRVRRLTQSLNVELEYVGTSDEALEAILRHRPEAILAADQLANQPIEFVIRRLRRVQCRKPIIVCVEEADGHRRAALHEAGANLILPTPLSTEVLNDTLTMSTALRQISPLARDADLRAIFQRFSDELPQRMAELERFASSADRLELHRSVSLLRQQAETYGFSMLAAAAAHLEQRVIDPEAIGDLRNELDRLARWCTTTQLDDPSDPPREREFF